MSSGACDAYAVHLYKKDICKECGMKKTDHTNVSSESSAPVVVSFPTPAAKVAPLQASAIQKPAMPAIRLKVELAGRRQVVPCVDPSVTIGDLLPILASRFGVNRIIHVTTMDDFELLQSDRVCDVLGNGDGLVALDFGSWLKTVESTCKNGFMKTTRWNWDKQGEDYWMQVGLTEGTKNLFFKAGRGKETDNLEVVDFQTLTNLKPGRKLVLRSAAKDRPNPMDDEKNPAGAWFTRGEIIVNKDGIPEAIEVSVKSPTDQQPQIDRIEISVDMEKYRVDRKDGQWSKTIQKAFKPLDSYNTKRTLPAPEYKGDKYPEPEEAKELEAKRNAALPANTVTNGIVSTQLARTQLVFTNKSKVWAQQQWADQQDGKSVFDTDLSMDTQILNQDNQDWTIMEVKSEWQDKNGNWQPAKRTFKKYDERDFWGKADDPFHLPAKEPSRYVFGMRVSCEAPQLDRERRLHGSFPQPFNFRFTLIESTGQQIIVNCVYNNPTLYPEVASKQSKWNYAAKNANSDKDVYGWAWVQCDDLAAECRCFVYGYYTKPQKDDGAEEGYWAVTHNLSSSSSYLYEDAFSKLALKASKENKTEMQLEDWSGKNDKGMSVDATALIDLQVKAVYAVRFTVKTNTGVASETFPLFGWKGNMIPKPQ